MSDGTRLDPGSGGDFVVDKDCSSNDGLPAGKVPISALVTLGGAGQDQPTNVKASNPLPVADAAAATALASLATQTTLAAVLAKLIAAPATEATLASVLAALQASLPLPTGASTAARQDTGNVSLASILSGLSSLATSAAQSTAQTSLSAIVTALGPLATQTTVAAILSALQSALPLPTGAATSAAQGTAQTSLSSLDTKTPALGQALAAASSPVVLTAAQDVVAYAPAKEAGGHLATIDTSTATTATQSTTTATNTGTLAGAVIGGKVLTTETSASAIATSAATTAAQTTTTATNTGTLATNLPAKGQALAAASMPVVLPTIQAAALAQDVTLTGGTQVAIAKGAAATGAAVSGNPVLVGGSDGTNAQALVTTTAGVLRVNINRGPPTTVATRASGTSLVAAGVSLRSGPGVVVSGLIVNSSGAAVVFMMFDATAQPSSGTVPIYESLIANNASSLINVASYQGTNGLWLAVCSGVAIVGTYTAAAGTTSSIAYSLLVE